MKTVIFYICPDDPAPSGGARVLYRHVDILNAHGIEAVIVHSRRPFRLSWFENSTPVAYPPLSVGPDDLLAVPEVLGDRLVSIAPGIPRVSLNQNAYNTFRWVRDPFDHPYDRCNDLVGVTAVSDDNAAYLRFAFPRLDVTRLRYGLDRSSFPDHPAHRRRAVAFMPRKRAGEATEVLALLQSRGTLRDWDVVPIEGRSQADVYRTLVEVPLFLSFSEREGCPFPPLEAMACGCYVIGFDGLGGSEYFDARFTTTIPNGDVRGFAEAIEQWTQQFEWDDSSRSRAAAAAEYVLDRYSPTAEASDVLDLWRKVGSQAGTPAQLVASDIDIIDRRPRWRRRAAGLKAAVRS